MGNGFWALEALVGILHLRFGVDWAFGRALLFSADTIGFGLNIH